MTIDIQWLSHYKQEASHGGCQWPVDRVDAILELDGQRRAANHRIDQYRTSVNRKEVSLEKPRLRELQSQYDNLVEHIRLELAQLRNQVDQEGDQHWIANDDDAVAIATVPGTRCDPVEAAYCIGAYENWGTSSATVLTGFGEHLLQGLYQHFVTGLSRQIGDDAMLHQSKNLSLPSVLPTTVASFHERLGCSSSPTECAACRCQKKEGEAGLVDAPSYVDFLDQLQGETFWDKELPVVYFLKLSHKSDDLESGYGSKSKKRPWYECLVQRDTLQILALTGSSLQADSRCVQHDFVEKFRAILNDLGVPTSVQAKSKENLAVSHSSCLEIRGCTTAIATKNKAGAVSLAQVINLQNFASKGLVHGNLKPERVHVVTVLLDLPATLDMIANVGSAEDGVFLPEALCPKAEGGSGYTKIPFLRRVVSNKSGRRRVEDIPVPKVKPNILDAVLMESISCPFDFLPFKVSP